MAVIKIVPMPGAVGDKGDEGAPGAQGLQGEQGLQGAPGADALWNYNGEWQLNSSYATGDVVTYQGQLYYAKAITTAGTLPTDISKFDLIAAKGSDGEPGLNGLEGETGPQGPAGADGSPGLVYLGDYVSGNGYIANIAVVKGADDNLYIAKASGGLLSPVANPGQWDLFLPKGANGADGATPFTLIGAYDNGASYNLGIAVYYNGGTYVRTGNPLNPGYPPEVGAINASWTPIAEKGEPGTPGSLLNYWDGTGAPQDPAEDGFLIIDGIVATNGSNILVSADDRVFIGGNNGEFLNGLSTPENQIATIGDIQTSVNDALPDEELFVVNGGTLDVQPTFTGAPLFTGSYVKHGPMVFFQVQVDMDNITSFGTGQYFIDLPFTAKYGQQFKEGCLHDISSGKQYAIGGHVYAGESRMSLTFTNSAGQDDPFDYNSPVVLSTADNFHISGTFISA